MNKKKKIKKLAELNNVPEEHICPKCFTIMKEEWENNGFQEPEGPSKWEITGLECPNCNYEK